MSRTKTVIVEGGGHNLYEIVESDGSFIVYKVIVHLFSNDRKNIGKTRLMEDAISLIRSHSGKNIKSIE